MSTYELKFKCPLSVSLSYVIGQLMSQVIFLNLLYSLYRVRQIYLTIIIAFVLFNIFDLKKKKKLLKIYAINIFKNTLLGGLKL